VTSATGATAIGAAHVRALESERADRMFCDPWAGRFVQAAGWSPPRAKGEPSREWTAIRSCARASSTSSS
jgi:O-methyltransferase involved in polyketide biosynthesis